MFSAHRPFKDLEAADITSASVRLSPPDTTIQIVETEELVSYLNEVVMILSILVDTFISKISFPMQPGPEIGSISDA